MLPNQYNFGSFKAEKLIRLQTGSDTLKLKYFKIKAASVIKIIFVSYFTSQRLILILRTQKKNILMFFAQIISLHKLSQITSIS